MHQINNVRYLPSREKLLGLSAKELRKQCELVGLDTRFVDRKENLAVMLYNYYHGTENEGDSLRLRDTFGSYHSLHGGSIGDEVAQMVAALQQSIPFYGQGDVQTDNIVRDTIRKLPREVLEMRDIHGNTIIMLAFQSGAPDLVPMLISRGSDVNAKNNDGVTCLHFACSTDSLSINTARVCSGQRKHPSSSSCCSKLVLMCNCHFPLLGIA